MNDVLAVAIAYLIGSIPFSLWLSRRHGIDVRYAGSGNVGATNVLRTVGVRAGVAALVLDVGKGAAAVLAARWLTESLLIQVAAALATIAGHIYPVWLTFRGGNGVATAAGAFGVLAPFPMAVAVAAFVVTVVVTRFASLGSIVGAITFASVALASDVPRIVSGGAVVVALVIIYGHRGNIARLIAGTERRLSRRPVSSVGR